MRLRGRDDFAFGGLWESSRAGDGAEVLSCTIITLPANSLMREIHNGGRNRHRMPLILPREAQRAWLEAPSGSAMGLVSTVRSEALEAWPVSTAVNNPNFNDVRVLDPVTLDY